MNARFDPNDAKSVAKAEKAARVIESQRKTVIQGIMSVRAGREWLYSLLATCGAFRTPYTGDTNSTMFNCGQQNVGLALLAQITEAAPDQVQTMLKEQDDDGRTEPDNRPDDGDATNDHDET